MFHYHKSTKSLSFYLQINSGNQSTRAQYILTMCHVVSFIRPFMPKFVSQNFFNSSAEPKPMLGYPVAIISVIPSCFGKLGWILLLMMSKPKWICECPFNWLIMWSKHVRKEWKMLLFSFYSICLSSSLNPERFTFLICTHGQNSSVN